MCMHTLMDIWHILTLSFSPSHPPTLFTGDVIFIVKAKKHDTFVRDGHNLVHIAEIPVAQALLGVTLVIKTLDDRVLRVAITQVVKYVTHPFTIL
ncbi:unnamed protein product [Dibothriocephalus latus]|uniref:Chaperone DnaJ C-terminal domain-containing protein n=1 Tax=Dibothriocephalus latus TaxID=60516 RepID=A0A3P7NYM3_DIBLA|nr:unnamed protein product [Dibothriocephalus latus]